MKENTFSKKSIVKKIIFIILAILIVLSLALLILIPFVIMPSFLGQRYEQKQYDSLDYGIPSERVALTTDDGLTLAAWRTRATRSSQPKGTVIILSGIQNPSVTAFFGYAKMLADNGWDSLLIEMRARSQSEGEEIGLGMTEWRDVKAGVDFLSADEAVKDLPIVAMGTSMGGGTVIIAAGEVPEIDGVVAISAFSFWSDLFVDNMTAMGLPQAIGKMEIPFLNLYLGIHYGFEALQYAPLNGIRKLADRPILMMHSTGDSQVPFSEFEKLRDEAEKHNVNLTTFVREGDEHFVCYEPYFDDPAGDSEFSRAILNFLEVNF
mgnify:CR=1 FL=1